MLTSGIVGIIVSMQDKKMNYFYVAFVFLFVLTVGFATFGRNLSTKTRASQKDISISKSLLIADKLEITAGSSDFAQVSVFVRAEDGTVLPNRLVDVTTTFGLVNPTSAQTDNYGKAVFVVRSTAIGDANLTARVNGVIIPQALTIKFIAAQ